MLKWMSARPEWRASRESCQSPMINLTGLPTFSPHSRHRSIIRPTGSPVFETKDSGSLSFMQTMVMGSALAAVEESVAHSARFAGARASKSRQQKAVWKYLTMATSLVLLQELYLISYSSNSRIAIFSPCHCPSPKNFLRKGMWQGQRYAQPHNALPGSGPERALTRLARQGYVWSARLRNAGSPPCSARSPHAESMRFVCILSLVAQVLSAAPCSGG